MNQNCRYNAHASTPTNFKMNHGHSICILKVGIIRIFFVCGGLGFFFSFWLVFCFLGFFFCSPEKLFLECASEVLVRVMINGALDFFM